VTRSQLARAVLWMGGTLLSFSAMAVSIRGLAGKFSTMEILSLRTGIGLAITLAIGFARPELLRTVRLRRLGTHFARNSTHLLGQFMWALSLTLLPLATVFALEFTMPVWTTLLAILMLGERATPSRIGALVCGFLGVLIVLRPGLDAFQPASLLVLAAAFCYSCANIATKKLTTTESTYAIVTWMGIMQLPIAYLCSDPLFFMKIEWANALAVAGVGIAGLSAHYCLTNALGVADAGVVIPLDFLRLPLIAVVGWLFYGEALEPLVFLGAGVIIAGVLWSLRAEAHGSGRSRPEPSTGRIQGGH
jgi:drug/metabolite transporter (DMT)-like permease